MPSIILKSAGDDLGYVEDLLAAADLPTEDVQAKPGSFVVALADGRRVGVGGIEQYELAGLLRSVVIDPEFRGEGYGASLCEALEGRARAGGVETLYLLTTTAADFFETQGYERIEQSAAPKDIQQTTEFADLCPDSATCMRRHLAE